MSKRCRSTKEQAIGENVRFDQIDQIPVHDKKGRCKHCSGGQTRWNGKYNVHLCLNDKHNCFIDFYISASK